VLLVNFILLKKLLFLENVKNVLESKEEWLSNRDEGNNLELQWLSKVAKLYKKTMLCKPAHV